MAKPWFSIPGPRWLRWLLASLLVVFALLVAVRILAATPLGRGLVEAQVEGLSISGQTIEIDTIEGDLLGAFSIGQIEVSDDAGVWLTLQGTEIDWSALALLGRRLAIDSVEIEDLHAERRPVLVSSGRSSGGGGSPLRSYGVEGFNVRTLRLDEGVAGPEVLAGLAARVETTIDTGTLDIALQPQTPSGDRVEGGLIWGGDIPLDGTLLATGPENGLLATLISPARRGPITLRVEGEGATERWSAGATLEIGEDVPVQLSAAGQGATSAANGTVQLSAFETTESLSAYLGDVLDIEIEQAETLTAKANSAQLSATVSAPWDAERLRPGLEEISLDARINRAFMLDEAGITLGGGTVSGTASLVGDLATFDGEVSLSDASLPGLSAGLIALPGQFRFDRASNTLQVNTDITTERFAPPSTDLAAYTGTQPSLSLAAEVSLESLQADIDTLALNARAGRLEASGSVGLARESIDLRGRIVPNGDAPLPGGVGIGAAQFTVRSAGRERLALSANVPMAFQEPPHPLLVGDIAASLTGILDGDNTLTVERLDMASDQISASATGSVSRDEIDASIAANIAAFEDGSLTLAPLNLALSVSGPFDTLALAGTLSGDGALIGETEIEAPRVTFTGAYGETGLSGLVQTEAQVDARALEAEANIALNGSAWRVDTLDAAFDALSLSGTASGTGSADLRADLSISAPSGVLEGVGALDGDIRLTQTDVDAAINIDGFARGGVSLDTITLTAMGPSSGVDGNLGLSGSMALAGMSRAISLSMPFNLDPRSRTVRLSPSARIDDLPIETLEPVRLTAGEAGIDAAGALSLLGGRLEFSGSRGEAGLALSASALDLDAAILARLSNRPALRGSVGGVLSLEGAGEELEGTLELILADIAQARPDAPEVSGTLETALGSDGMQAVLSLSDAEGALNLTGRAELPVLTSADPFEVRLPTGASLQSEFNGTGAIEPIWSIIGPADTALTGQFELAATVNGPLSDLAPEGSLVIREGDLEDALVGLHLKEIDLTADLDPQAVSVRSLSAQGWRGGRVTGSGRYGFGGTSSVALQLDQLDALQRDDLRAVVSGRLSLTDEENGASLAGRLIFESAEVNVDELPSGGYTTLDVQFPNGNGEIKTDDAPERVPIALDIDLDADRRIQIIGAGLETEWRIDANLGGTVRAPFLTGSADLVRGDLDVLGRAFPLEGSAIRFNGPVEDAELALRAQRTEDGFMAGFAITGTAGAPEFGLTSSPQVPDDEVLSRALFGTSPSQLSALQAAQLAAGLAQLAGGGGPDLFGGLEDALDVDRIDLGFEEDGAASIGAGKYIAEDVYLEVTTTTRGAPGLGVQWTPRDNIEVGAEFGTEVPPRFSLQWTRDYGGPDTPPEPEVEPSEPDEES